jgi:uncharacterized protein
VQVCWQLDAENRARELRGLKCAAERFGLKEAVILTASQEETIAEGGLKVRVAPAWKWVLEMTKT